MIPPFGAFSSTNPSTYNYSMATTIIDSLGIGNHLSLYFVKSERLNEWIINIYVNNSVIGTGIVTFTNNGELATATGLSNLTFEPTTGAFSISD